MKKIVERTCIVCRRKDDKNNFIKIVRNKNGQIELDSHQNKNGRGCYLCNNSDCIEKLKKTKALNRVYKINLQEETYDRVLQGINSTR